MERQPETDELVGMMLKIEVEEIEQRVLHEEWDERHAAEAEAEDMLVTGKPQLARESCK